MEPIRVQSRHQLIAGPLWYVNNYNQSPVKSIILARLTSPLPKRSIFYAALPKSKWTHYMYFHFFTVLCSPWSTQSVVIFPAALKVSDSAGWEGAFTVRNENSDTFVTSDHFSTQELCPQGCDSRDDRTRPRQVTSGVPFVGFQWMTLPSRLRTTSSGATMPSLRQSYAVTGPVDPAAVPMHKRDLHRKNQAVSRSKLVSTFMGLIINQAKVSPPAEVGLHLLDFILIISWI